LEQPPHVTQFPLATDQRSRLDRKIRWSVFERPRRRKVVRNTVCEQLVEALRVGQILQTVPAKVAETKAVDLLFGQELVDHLGNKHLPAVRSGCDSCGTVNRESNVFVPAHQSLPGVKSHPNAKLYGRGPLLRGNPLLYLTGGRDGVAWTDERNEERIAFCIDFAPVVGGDLSQYLVVLSENGRVTVSPQLMQQLRRALDVGEQERDGAGREFSPHPESIARI
jgi:hypothetical protein